jgi:hypothetical protein
MGIEETKVYIETKKGYALKDKDDDDVGVVVGIKNHFGY